MRREMFELIGICTAAGEHADKNDTAKLRALILEAGAKIDQIPLLEMRDGDEAQTLATLSGILTMLAMALGAHNTGKSHMLEALTALLGPDPMEKAQGTDEAAAEAA